jgi:hypothetical protein
MDKTAAILLENRTGWVLSLAFIIHKHGIARNAYRTIPICNSDFLLLIDSLSPVTAGTGNRQAVRREMIRG